MPKHKIRCVGIEWDTDGQEVDLPTEVVVEIESGQDPADVLAETYGFCVIGLDEYNA